MHVNLRDLKPNPTRNFKVDPLDEDVVENLRKSIKQDGFWGGVVARKIKGGDIQVAAGWHRVKAAIKAGVTDAEIYVTPHMDDANMIRIYTMENATQRGNTGTAMAGSIAATIKFLAKALMTGATREIPSSLDLEVVRQRLSDERGLGEPIITEFLGDVPGINENSVRQQLGILKSSGDYALIIKEVKDEIERENKEAIKALEKADREAREAAEASAKAERERKEAAARAKAAREEAERKKAELDAQHAEAMAKLAEKRQKEAKEEAAKFDALRTNVTTARKASDAANGVEITFDFEGVAKHLRTASHIEAFREEVTAQGIRPFLPVKKQAALAADLVKRAKDVAKESGKELDRVLTGSFISSNIGSMVHSIVVENKRFAKEETDRLKKQNWESQWRSYQGEFSRNARGLLAAAMSMAKHAKHRPSGVTLLATGEFRDSMKKIKDAIKLIDPLL